MISKISVIQYRKLKNIDLAFSSQLNFISGVNGTCKSSLLHMIANSFCEVGAKNASLKDPNCLPIIKSINSEFNPKIETLTKGDKKYNNPAIGVKGVLFSVTYADGRELKFRRHNSSKNNRYAIYIAPIERSAKLRESSERRDYGHEKTMDRQGKARDSA